MGGYTLGASAPIEYEGGNPYVTFSEMGAC